MNIPGLSPSVSPESISASRGGAAAKAAQATPETSFGEMLDSLNELQANSDDLLARLSAGEDVDLHDVMIASEQTDVGFRVALAIRDRLVEAYREVMRMSV